MIRSTIAIAAALLAAAAPCWAGDGGFTSLRHIPETAWERAEEPAARASAASADLGDAPRGVSVGRAVLYSLILPGWGDYAAGYKERARYFFIAEAAAWTSFVVFRLQGHRDEDAYKDFAVQFAGVRRTDHSDDFYVELREWDSSDAYEAFLKAEGRVELFPDVGAGALETYYLEKRVSDFEAWEWESFDRRLQFGALRSSSRNAYRRSTYSVAAAALNRLVSAVFADQAVRSADHSDSNVGRYRIDLTPPGRYAAEYDAAVSVVRTF